MGACGLSWDSPAHGTAIMPEPATDRPSKGEFTSDDPTFMQ